MALFFRRRRRKTVRPEDLPKKVSFDEIDYQGEHMDLAVPIEAEVSLDENGDVFILNEESHVYGIGPTLDDAKRDFCGSFLLCYKILEDGGPGCNPSWKPIMRHAFGEEYVRKETDRQTRGPSREGLV